MPLHRTEEVVHNYSCDGPAPGNIAFRWLYGSNIAALNRDPRIQVVQYNEDTFILRQNVCVHWEAPFTYLLFGNQGALLIDTGATAEANYYPLRSTVDAIVTRWSQMRRQEKGSVDRRVYLCRRHRAEPGTSAICRAARHDGRAGGTGGFEAVL